MDIINFFIQHQDMLNTSITDLIIIIAVALSLFGVYLLFKNIEKISMDIVNTKIEIYEHVDDLLLKHQKICSDKNNNDFAKKNEISALKESIDNLNQTIAETRKEISQATRDLYTALLDHINKM